MRNELNAAPASDWERIRPLIDQALDVLPPADREAVLLHFFEGRSFVEVGASLALSADAARMRVNRALDRLREALARRGIASTGAVLSGVLATQQAVAAPAPLAASVAGHALAQARALGSISRAAQWAHAVKSAPALTAGGALLLAGLLGGAAYSFSPRTAEPARDSTAGRVTRSAPVTTTGVEISALAVDDAAPDDPPPAAVAAKTAPVARDVSFGQLRAEEQHLLKALWSHEEESVPLPGHRWALRVQPSGEKFPDFAVGRRMLRVRGWVKVHATGAALLTPAGLAYCAAHRDEIATYPRFFKNATEPAP